MLELEEFSAAYGRICDASLDQGAPFNLDLAPFLQRE
jgi:hypothetical protein